MHLRQNMSKRSSEGGSTALIEGGPIVTSASYAQTMNFSVFTDTYPSSDYSTVYSTDTIQDHSIGCTHSSYSYTAGLYSPTKRNAYTQGFGLIGNTSIPVFNEVGTYDWYAETQYYCSCIKGFGGAGGGGGFILTYTQIQHNYPSNPLPQACKITSWFDAQRGWGPHHAEDLVFTGGSVPVGTPVTAMESGTVLKAIGGLPNAGSPPSCPGGHAGDYVKIKSDSDGYSTVYFHMTPAAGIVQNVHVNAGQIIGYLDTSGCQSAPHLHVARKDPSGNLVNFTIPCVNQLPTTTYDDGTIEDNVPDNSW